MNRVTALFLPTVLGAVSMCLPACETLPEEGVSVNSATSRQAPPPLVTAPAELRESPEWVMIEPVRVAESVRFSEFDPGMSAEALAEYFRREIRDQVVDAQHFRVYGEYGEKSPHLARYIVRGTLRRLDIGPEFDADVSAARAMGRLEGTDVQVQRVRPVTCELRLELVGTDKLDPRIGLEGETVAIGDAEVSFNVGSKFSVLTDAHRNGTPLPADAVIQSEAVKVQREQIPGCLLRSVRLALNNLLTKANEDVFLKEYRLAEMDREAAEERGNEPVTARPSAPVRYETPVAPHTIALPDNGVRR